MSYEEDQLSHKTGRIAILALMICILGAFFFAYKVNACAEKAPQPYVCKDEFFQVDTDHPAHACSPGAKAEWVTSPPAPKPGIMCHCVVDATPPAPANTR